MVDKKDGQKKAVLTLHQLRADAIVRFDEPRVENPEDLPANVRLKKLLDKMRELNRRVDELADSTDPEIPPGGRS